MSRKYKFHNPDGLYFMSFAAVNWLDVFTRNEYKDILLQNLSFYQNKKDKEYFGIMIESGKLRL